MPDDNFNWKVKNLKRSYHCKFCSQSYVNEHYKRNKSYYLHKAYKRNLKVRKSVHDFLGLYLKYHPCIDCGESDILVLEFDHRDPSQKTDDVSRMITANGSLEKIKNEISKCDVRCANCHRRKTLIQSQNWKVDYVPVAQLDRALVFGTRGLEVRSLPGTPK